MSAFVFQNIGLRPAQWKAVEKKARHSGQTAPEYVRALIERDLLAGKSFDEILRPIRDDIARKNITNDRLDDLVRRARRTGRPRKARGTRA